MKRVLAIILSLVMVLGLCACGEKDTDNAIENHSAEQIEDSNSENADNQSEENQINLMYTFEDPSKPVVFDYPNLKCIEEGTSRVFKNSKYVLVYCRDTMEAELADIPEKLAEKFSNAINSYIEGSFASFNIVDTAEIQVNGADILCVKGNIISTYDDGSTINLPLCGYTFSKDGTIYELLSVLNEETNEINQTEMEATIEAMINTLREDR